MVQDVIGGDIGKQTLVHNEQALLDDEEMQLCIFVGNSAIVTLCLALLLKGTKIAVRLERCTKIEKRWGLGNCSIALYCLDAQMNEGPPLSAYYVSDGTEIDVQVTLFEEGR
ncbi:hypothetical protein ACJRO7_007048 [Eucalyptus globulus]|uniref:Uncharacterized protein n=1 Tax=Eucalyptus globulus TaxID=34317 RepID=A0ABD3IJU7_EUCGL